MPELTNAERLDEIRDRVRDKEIVEDDFFFVVGLARGLWTIKKDRIGSYQPPICPIVEHARPLEMFYMFTRSSPCLGRSFPNLFTITERLDLDPLFTLVGTEVGYEDAKRWVNASYFIPSHVEIASEEDWRRWHNKFHNASGPVVVIE